MAGARNYAWLYLVRTAEYLCFGRFLSFLLFPPAATAALSHCLLSRNSGCALLDFASLSSFIPLSLSCLFFFFFSPLRFEPTSARSFELFLIFYPSFIRFLDSCPTLATSFALVQFVRCRKNQTTHLKQQHSVPTCLSQIPAPDSENNTQFTSPLVRYYSCATKRGRRRI